eukprot:GDKI01029632.1.p2 GENE.GDKI01029632.1~~GDKI01029632.1.p2  ORF type:complete len:219 (+),score=71.25 GDKI01029632.1:89-745(+)
MRIGVFGGTGSTGLHFVQQALQKGHHVTVLVRDANRLGELQGKENLTVVQGSALKQEDVDKVVTGQDVIFTALGGRSGDDTRYTVCSQNQMLMNNSILKEKERGNQVPRRVVCVTSMGCGDSYQHMNCVTWMVVKFLLKKSIEDKNKQEELITDHLHGVCEWTIVRPGGLVDGQGTGVWNASPTIGGGSILRADVAKFCVEKCLEGAEYACKAVSVVN